MGMLTMHHLSKFLFVILLSFSTTTFSQHFFLNVFEKELPVPIDYMVNPWGYSKNTKVRLIKKSDDITNWSEITVLDIAECEGDCMKLFSEEENVTVLTKDNIHNIHFIKFEYVSHIGEEFFYFIYDEKILIRIKGDNDLIELWKKLLSL